MWLGRGGPASAAGLSRRVRMLPTVPDLPCLRRRLQRYQIGERYYPDWTPILVHHRQAGSPQLGHPFRDIGDALVSKAIKHVTAQRLTYSDLLRIAISRLLDLIGSSGGSSTGSIGTGRAGVAGPARAALHEPARLLGCCACRRTAIRALLCTAGVGALSGPFSDMSASRRVARRPFRPWTANAARHDPSSSAVSPQRAQAASAERTPCSTAVTTSALILIVQRMGVTDGSG